MASRRVLLTGLAGATVSALAGCSAGATAPTSGATAGSGSLPPSGTPSATPGTSPTRAPARSPSSKPSPSPSSTGTPQPKLGRTIAEDLNVPWSIVFLRSGDALVSERDTGHVLRITLAGKVTNLGRVAGVAAPTGLGEGGLLGLALAPGDEDTLFAYITTTGDNRVVRFSIAGGRVGKPHAVLPGIPTSTHHHGGRLLFGPDGRLFVSTGDAEQSELAQRKGSLAGKILRLRPDGRAAAGNPYGNRTWTYGHRNVEGLAFDAQGRLWATEFGEKKTDELNLLVKGGNYGWPDVEGRSSSPRYRSPKATWSPTSSCSPAGLAITRNTAFVGALQGKCLFSVPLDGEQTGEPTAHFADDHGRIRDVVVAPDRALWMTTSNTDGRATAGRHDDMILRVSL